MRVWAVLLIGCVSPADPEGSGRTDSPAPGDDSAADTDPSTPTDDTAAPPDDTGAPPGETGEPADPCAGADDPARGMGLRDLLGRLQAQRCLSPADQDATIAFVDSFRAEHDVWCDAVYRLSSPDGLVFDGEPELVREHASVADVVITPDGAHVLVYNDLRPDVFAATLRADPERFWRQGLVGVGGLGMAMDRGEGFYEVPLDLHLPLLALVVDPDLSRRPAGDFRLVTFQVPFAELDGTVWDPLQTSKPHDYFRAVSPVFGAWPTPTHVVASQTGAQGGADPTVLDVPDGEILFLGDFAAPLVGWHAPNGQYPSPDVPPDVAGGLGAAAPDAIADPDGAYRLYYMDPSRGNELWLATSDDGRGWTPVAPATSLSEVHSPSVARGEDAWWLYFNHREAGCMEANAFAQTPGGQGR